jgi:hypothetical protein
MLKSHTRFVLVFLLFVSAVGLAVGAAVARVRTGSAQGTGPTLSVSASGLSVSMVASGSGFDPYGGYTMSLAYDPGLLAFLGASNQTGGAPPCVYQAAPGTMVFNCMFLTGGTTATGTLATADFAPATASPACAGVHLVSYGPPDNGDSSNGSSTVDPDSIQQANAYGAVDVEISVNGGDCAPGTSTPVVPTATGTATPIPTATATPQGPPIETTVKFKSQALLGFAGTIDFGAVSPPQAPTSGVVVHFARRLSSPDYAVLVTPVDRWCSPVVTNKTARGFTIYCPGIGGSVDFVVLPQDRSR